MVIHGECPNRVERSCAHIGTFRLYECISALKPLKGGDVLELNDANEWIVREILSHVRHKL